MEGSLVRFSRGLSFLVNALPVVFLPCLFSYVVGGCILYSCIAPSLFTDLNSYLRFPVDFVLHYIFVDRGIWIAA